MSKPRNKAYRPRAITMPAMLQVQMTREAHPGLALELHLSIINLIEAPTVAACNKLSFDLCCIAGGMSHANRGEPIMGKTDADSIAIQSAIRTIEAIVDRHDRVGDVIVSEFDALSLRAAAGKLDGALGRIPLPAYNRAVREVENFVGKRKQEA